MMGSSIRKALCLVLIVAASSSVSASLTIPSPFVEMDENFLLLSIFAAELSSAVNADNTPELFPLSISWINEPDKAMIVKIESICWVAFRATTWTSDDWAQNVDPRKAKDVCNSLNDCCSTRQGFRDAYIEVNYLNDLENSLEDCVAQCCADPDNCQDGEEKCEVVLTGTSQGGAVAHVATVYLQDYKPTTITFGQPPTTEEPCTAIDTDRLYRFVNTVEVGDDLQYDPVPFLNFGGVDHMGHMFVLGEDPTGVAYYKDHEAPDVGLLDWTLLNILSAHSIDSNIVRLERLLANGDFPVRMDGWGLGHLCTQDSECVAPHICGRGRCSNGEVDASCWYESDCLPGNTCEGILSPSCEAKRSRGSYCNEGTDCTSGRCNLTWRGFKCG